MLLTMALHNNPRGRQAVYVTTIFTAIAALTVGLRLYTRFLIVRSAGVEDYFVLLAMVSILEICGRYIN